MSGFYSKMLINIRNLYFNNSDDMKTILHGIFLDAADVFLNGYIPSYCEENELIPTAQKFVEKFGSAKACETGVTKEAVASAMCNPAALVALMHDSDYDVLKEAFYYACDMFIVIKSEHYDCTNLICKKDTLEEAAAAVRESIAQRINKNYHTGLTGADITHENEERYRFSFDFDENCPADNSEPRVHATYDFWKGDDEESVEWAVFEVTTDKPFFLLSYEEYESIELTGFYDSFDEAFEEMKELIAESVNDVFDEDATADDVEDMEDYNVFVHSNKDSKDSGAPLAFASFCDDYPNREWTIFHI